MAHDGTLSYPHTEAVIKSSLHWLILADEAAKPYGSVLQAVETQLLGLCFRHLASSGLGFRGECT